MPGAALAAWMRLLTPTLLLVGRVGVRRLVPTMVLAAIAVAVLEAVSRMCFPGMATANAERHGLIGFAFSLFSWSGSATAISGYLGRGPAFVSAVAEFAERYADQTVADHTALAEAARSGRIEVAHEEAGVRG